MFSYSQYNCCWIHFNFHLMQIFTKYSGHVLPKYIVTIHKTHTYRKICIMNFVNQTFANILSKMWIKHAIFTFILDTFKTWIVFLDRRSRWFLRILMFHEVLCCLLSMSVYFNMEISINGIICWFFMQFWCLIYKLRLL